ncbi:AI-2E family transporter [Herbiconiux moechotypicola]|uniref:AI-2E family transporter n=1 Tax=Herbiconiux moechotypicola TaxID=637393 RepID=A0ABN3DQ27_9MICO|nr:AI-2E family transporter [Herbiconiux moechotypicola]MCS5731728.1 AI-2E family transporter [Herbiconiux moechotypicola]
MRTGAFRIGFIATLGGLIAIALGFAFVQLSTVVICILAALFLALGLDPLVRWLTRRRIPRGWSIVIVFILVIAFAVLVFFLVIPAVVTQTTEMVEALPQLVQSVSQQAWFTEVFGSSVDTQKLVHDLETYLSDPNNIATLSGGVLKIGMALLNGLTGGILVVVLTLFFLSSLDAVKAGFYILIPASRREGVASITEQIVRSIGKYVSGQVILAGTNGVFGFIAMLIIGVPFAGALAVVAFMLALIPLVGTVISAILITFIALTDSPTEAIAIGIYFLVYMQVEAYVFSPRIMNKAVDVPGILVVIGALVGGTLLGVLGALIAVPVVASLLIIVKQVVVPRQALQ